MTNHTGADEADFLLVNEEGWFRRHLPLALAALIVLALIVLGTIWELTSTSSSASSSGAPVAGGAPLGGLPSPTPTAPRQSRSAHSAATYPGLVTVTVHAPPRIVVHTDTVTVTPPPAATRVVPDLIDSKLYETQAASILGSIGLTVNAVSDPAPPGSPESFIGLVTAQDTAPGSVVPVGTSITLHEYS